MEDSPIVISSKVTPCVVAVGKSFVAETVSFRREYTSHFHQKCLAQWLEASFTGLKALAIEA